MLLVNILNEVDIEVPLASGTTSPTLEEILWVRNSGLVPHTRDCYSCLFYPGQSAPRFVKSHPVSLIQRLISPLGQVRELFRGTQKLPREQLGFKCCPADVLGCTMMNKEYLVR